MREKYEQKIRWFCLYSRCSVIAIQFVSNWAFPDHAADAFKSPAEPNIPKTDLDILVHSLLGGFLRWDAQYFWHIIRYGYTYENVLAFFPLYPLLVRCISAALHPLLTMLSMESMRLLVAHLVNVWVFGRAAQTLFRLTDAVFANCHVAYLTALLFAINPASVFFSAPYSECLFAWFTFSCMLASVNIYKQTNRRDKGGKAVVRGTTSMFDSMSLFISFSLPCGLSGVTRSNGLLNLVFYLYFWVKCVVQILNQSYGSLTIILELFNLWVQLAINVLISVAPFVLFQVYSYHMFCTDFPIQLPAQVERYAHLKRYVLPGNHSLYKQPWCYNSIPLAYSYVQNHYWDVGFLKYYQLKQLPNFLLALPILTIFTYYNWLFLRNNLRKLFLLDARAIFMLHSLFLTVFCVFFVHIQVSTRLLCSASPVLYWFCAHQMFNFIRVNDNDSLECAKNCASGWRTFLLTEKFPKKLLIIKYYFLGYAILGTVLFSNFLPWT